MKLIQLNKQEFNALRKNIDYVPILGDNYFHCSNEDDYFHYNDENAVIVFTCSDTGEVIVVTDDIGAKYRVYGRGRIKNIYLDKDSKKGIIELV